MKTVFLVLSRLQRQEQRVTRTFVVAMHACSILQLFSQSGKQLLSKLWNELICLKQTYEENHFVAH